MRRTDARNSLKGICRITDGCQCLAVAGEGAAFGEEIQEAVFEGLIAEALHEIDAVGGALAGEVFDKGIEALDVALDIALGEPEAAGFAGFDLGEFDFAFEVGLPILGVEDVKEVGLPRPSGGAGDGGLGAGGIPTKKIGDDEDDAVALPRGMEVAKAAVEIRDAIKFDATDGLQDLFNIALPAQGGELLADGIAEGVEADALLIAEAEVGERDGGVPDGASLERGLPCWCWYRRGSGGSAPGSLRRGGRRAYPAGHRAANRWRGSLLWGCSGGSL